MKYFFRKGWRDDDDHEEEQSHEQHPHSYDEEDVYDNLEGGIPTNPIDTLTYPTSPLEKKSKQEAGPKDRALPQARNSAMLEECLTRESSAVVHSITDKSENSLSDFLVNLPNDALHTVSAFLTPMELCMLGQTCKSARKATRSVWKRVRMHGYHCAVNIVTAFLRDEISDAKELVGLYCRAGVPFYPGMSSHKMAFPTIVWRMGCEIVHRRRPEVSPPDGVGNDLGDVTTQATRNIDQFFTDRYETRLETDYFLPLLRSTYLEEKSLFWIHQPLAISNRGNNRRGSQLDFSSVPNTTVSIHKHLFDQHILGRSSIDDETDDLRSEISLSVDFFHPCRNHYTTSASVINQMENLSRYPVTMGEIMVDESESNYSRLNGLPEKVYNALSEVTIDVYSAPVLFEGQDNNVRQSGGGPIHIFTERDQKLHEAKDLFHRFRYQLEVLFDSGDEEGFDECLAEFWDSFFKATAGISYYDRHTAVPRISKLERFLKLPCPKGVGVIQCEIERIRKADQTVKGRLFPTYDYRLFIRNRHDSTGRRDMNLMVARNIGRHRSKRGVNNYMIYQAKQDSIYEANGDEDECQDNSTDVVLGRLQSNFIGNEFQIFSCEANDTKGREGISDSESGKCPCKSQTKSKSDIQMRSTKEYSSTNQAWNLDHHSDVDKESNVPRFVRRIGGSFAGSFSRGRSPSRNNWVSNISVRKTKKIAIADPAACIEEQQEENDHNADDKMEEYNEVEEGAITYTANLLGNRPRVMDVCIPKVGKDGKMQDWRKFYNGDLKMIHCFKELQERLNNENNLNEAVGVIDENEDDSSSETTDYGLLALQNKQPWWNVELGAFVLNFGGRVSVASVKNFQLCARDDQEHIMLQFGRVQGRHSFTMDFQYPLTAIQAFAIAISSLQSKMSLA